VFAAVDEVDLTPAQPLHHVHNKGLRPGAVHRARPQHRHREFDPPGVIPDGDLGLGAGIGIGESGRRQLLRLARRLFRKAVHLCRTDVHEPRDVRPGGGGQHIAQPAEGRLHGHRLCAPIGIAPVGIVDDVDAVGGPRQARAVGEVQHPRLRPRACQTLRRATLCVAPRLQQDAHIVALPQQRIHQLHGDEIRSADHEALHGQLSCPGEPLRIRDPRCTTRAAKRAPAPARRPPGR